MPRSPLEALPRQSFFASASFAACRSDVTAVSFANLNADAMLAHSPSRHIGEWLSPGSGLPIDMTQSPPVHRPRAGAGLARHSRPQSAVRRIGESVLAHRFQVLDRIRHGLGRRQSGVR